MQIKDAFRAAVENITRYGDTDVFPFPIENHVFFDCIDAVVQLLLDIHKDQKTALQAFPPMAEGMLATVGYTGFRWVTQIDPLWNAYFLGLVIAAGDDIEAVRLSLAKETVFSYRFDWNDAEKTVFDKSVGWVEFQKMSVERARDSQYVLACDISDSIPVFITTG